MLNAWQNDAFYRFLPTIGWVKNDSDRLNHSLSFSGKTLLAIAREQWDDTETLQQAKRLMRQVLTDLMNAKPIYSRQMFVKVWEQA
jgi:DNA repair protein RecO (recombination protein O)